MKRVCPNPIPWQEAFDRLTSYAELHSCTPPSPPKPLILAGWVYSNDVQKMERWRETTVWAASNGCTDLLCGIPEQDFYFTDNPTSYAIGPGGGPTYAKWDFETKCRPLQEQLVMHMNTLLTHWSEIVGRELASITRPIEFTGEKARRLLVLADSAATPPWGGWSSLSTREPERRTFTNFRAAINEAIAPHEIDHIDFTTELKGVHGSKK